MPTAGGGRAWWIDATVYQIYVRSFADGNGDGVGDLGGVLSRLAHLEDLGVDAVWLTPCYPSPQHDHGYDVADYLGIEPQYGDLETFDTLVATAHRHGIRVLMDIVPNHCSDQHVWFQAALHSPAGSAERQRFWFRDGRGRHGEQPPNNWRAVFGGPAWTRVTEPDGTPGQWYLHTFTPWQPDFNWHHPDVVEHFDEVLRFWFDRGVDGFRVDAVTVVGKHPDLPDAPPVDPALPETDAWAHNPYAVFWPSAHEHWRHWRQLIDGYEADHPGRSLVTVSEAYTPRRPDLLLRYVQQDQFHQSFCFDLMLTPWCAPLIHEAVDGVVRIVGAEPGPLAWTLNNHDTQRAVTRYGRADATDPHSWTGNNLVSSVAEVDLALGTRRSRAMIAFAAALPGTLYLYQGEELGLPEVLDIPADRRQDPIVARTGGKELGRDGCRVPLPWTASAAHAHGFSTADVEPWLPQPDDWGRFAVDPEHDDPLSMFRLYQRVLRCRRALAAEGPLTWLTDLDADRLVGFRRGETAVVLNVSADDVDLPPSLTKGTALVLSTRPDWSMADVIPADTCLWLRR